MSQTLDEVRQMTLVQAGFLNRNGDNRPGLLDADSAARQTDTSLRYSNLFNEIAVDLRGDDLIYESPHIDRSLGTPCAYLKALPDPSPFEISTLRKKIWNHGRIPTLWVITEQGLRIYNAFARPEDEDPSRHLLRELTAISGQLQGIQEFRRQHFDDGSFWHAGVGRQIDPSDRVDRALLKDLQDTVNLLGHQGLRPPASHGLLRQTVFIKYLEDRGILTAEHFRQHGSVDNFVDLMSSENGARSLFSWARRTFNGDLFPDGPEYAESINSEHFDIIGRFLSGHRMEGYPQTQARLWPYSFRLIPIELISSIYEMFAHAEDPAIAENLSVHYTRFGLVELMLSRTMRGLADTAKILDPACGSGVFLVEAFRRLVRSKAQRLGRQLSRPELEDILKSQIYGIDIDRDAVSVAAFSLYLALLEMGPDPQAGEALTLPHLIAGPSDHQPGNLYVQDFFNTKHRFNRTAPFAEKSFDLVVSNPPWTALKSTTAPRDPESPDRAPQWGYEYVKAHNVPRRNPDQGFIHRVQDFAGPDALIAMVIGTRFLHQGTKSGRQWLQRFFSNNSVHSIIDLSDLVNDDVLFGSQSSTRLPACVITFAHSSPRDHHEIEYITPRRYAGVDNRNEIIVTTSDIQSFPQSLINDGIFRWKTAFRGYPRDLRILYRLNERPSLDQVLDEVGISTGSDRGRGITFGGGEQQDAGRFKGLPFLPGRAAKRRFLLNADSLPIFDQESVSTRSNRLILRLPAMVLARSLSRRRPAAALVEPSHERNQLVIPQSYYGISFPTDLRWLSYRINASLNSEFAIYWTFMTSSQFGLDRRLVEVRDWLELPLPQSILIPDAPQWEDALRFEAQLRTSPPTSREFVRHQEALDSAVYDLYGFSQQDTLLMRETVAHKILPYLGRSTNVAYDHPTADQLKDYALRVCRQLNGILSTTDRRFLPTIFTFPASEGIAACRLHLEPGQPDLQVREVDSPEIQALLDRMSPPLRAPLADNLFVQQDLRVYDEDATWVIKASDLRLWTEAAALHDADLIMQEHIEGPA